MYDICINFIEQLVPLLLPLIGMRILFDFIRVILFKDR